MSSYKLLNVDSNAKTVKGQKEGFLTGVLYLAPYKLSGFNTCPMADIAQCAHACLNTAGRAGIIKTGESTNPIQQARIRKTKQFYNERDTFMHLLVKDIERLIKQAKRDGFIPLVRLNGTSDIRWENIRFDYEFIHGKTRNVTIFELFPEVQFYDYTKLPNRKSSPKNYDLTFSYSGVKEYQKYAMQAIASGMRLAVVFRLQDKIPSHYLGLPCVDGDNTDIRHLDPKRSIVALYAKGKAKKDYSGFVIDINPV
jgi:hypothetical protein